MVTKCILHFTKRLAILFLCIAASGAFSHTINTLTIGIIVPLEHAALKDIVTGFKSVVSQQYPNIIFKVQNAQGDIKLQRNIIELFVGQKIDMIVPIGTMTTQMTLSLVKKQPIVALAAEYSESDRQKRIPKNVTGVIDEIGVKRKLELLRYVIPDLKNLTVIFHSGNEKNYKEMETLEVYATKLGIKIQKLVIQTLPDLGVAAKAVATNTQAILVFKDHLVISGIRLLIPIAEERGIPLISSDEGSVREGAAFALSVREKAIGEAGGKLAIKILQGVPIESLPIQDIQDLTLFYNQKCCENQKVDINKLKGFTNKNHYGFLEANS
jgi:putative ABC transport system substrate-binding protein